MPGWFRDQALAELMGSRSALREARDGIQEMQDAIARAARRLEDVDWAQRGGDWPPPADRRVLVQEFADQCTAAAAIGSKVGSELAHAQGRLVAARQVVEEWRPRSAPEQDEQLSLRHRAVGLHRILDEARMDLERIQASLTRASDAAGEALSNGDRTRVERVHTDLMARTLHTATSEGHRVDEAISRVRSQTGTAVLAGDDAARAARERMRGHRDSPSDAPTPPPGVDR